MDLAVRGKLATKGTESILGAFVLQRCQVHSCITSIAKERVPNASVPGAVALGSNSRLACRFAAAGSGPKLKLHQIEFAAMKRFDTR